MSAPHLQNSNPLLLSTRKSDVVATDPISESKKSSVPNDAEEKVQDDPSLNERQSESEPDPSSKQSS